MKIIFLDIDGVLNFQSHYEALRITKKELKKAVKSEKIQRFEYYSESINFDALKRIELLCEKTGASIVISSTWRKSMNPEQLNEVFRYCGLEKDLQIIDVTPVLYFKNYESSVPRGCEIDKWLDDKGFYNIFWSKEEQQKYIDKSGIENYIILDDDSDMLYNQRNHFIPILPAPRHMDGFDEKYYQIALDKLSKTAIELNF